MMLFGGMFACFLWAAFITFILNKKENRNVKGYFKNVGWLLLIFAGFLALSWIFI